MKIIWSIFILFLFWCNASLANNLKVIDGDTIVLNGEKIRFSGIDTPELKQTCLQNDVEVDCGISAKILLVKKIGNNTPQTAVDTVDQRFDEFKETSIDASKVQTIFLGGDESGVADSPTDSFGVSLNVITTDCNHKTFRRIDMGSVEAQVGVVDFGYVANSN